MKTLLAAGVLLLGLSAPAMAQRADQAFQSVVMHLLLALNRGAIAAATAARRQCV